MPCLLLDGDEDGVIVDRYGMESMAMFPIRFWAGCDVMWMIPFDPK
jgi:hypothetical protein